MLPKEKRVGRKSFSRLVGARTFGGKLFTLKCTKLSLGLPTKISVVTSKKISNKAVVRNQLRRRFYGAIEKSMPKTSKNFLCVYYLRRESLEKKFSEIEKEVRLSLGKVGILD